MEQAPHATPASTLASTFATTPATTLASTLSPLTSQGGGRPLEVDGRLLKLVIAGDGPARKELGQYAADRALPVTFVGNLSQTALPPFYRAADVFVTCSTSETPTYLSILGLYLPLLPSYHLPIPGAPPRRPTASPCSRPSRAALRWSYPTAASSTSYGTSTTAAPRGAIYTHIYICTYITYATRAPLAPTLTRILALSF